MVNKDYHHSTIKRLALLTGALFENLLLTITDRVFFWFTLYVL